MQEGMTLDDKINYNEMALEYKSLIHKIKNMISGINNLGFDISRYENILLEIIRKTESASNVQLNPNYANRNIVIDYSRVLSDLKRLDLELSEKYGIYYEVNKTCEYIKQVLKQEVNINQLTYIADITVKMLNKIIGANLQLNDCEEELIKDIYKVAYNIIKLEFVMLDNSRVYKHAHGGNVLAEKTSLIHLYFFDMCVKDEISKFDLDDIKYAKIKEMILDVERKGLGASYLDKNLIMEIISHTGSGIEYLDKITSEIYGLCNKICENKKKINNDIEFVFNTREDYKESKKKYRLSKKGLGKNITILSLTSSIVLGSYAGVITFAIKGTQDYVYKKESRVYSELTDSYSEPTSEEYLYSYDSKENEVLVKVYSNWDTSGEEPVRKIETYDLSEITVDSIYELLDCVLTDEYLIDTESISSDYYFDKDKYAEEFREIIFNEYTYQNEKKVDVGLAMALSLLCSILYLFVIVGIFLLCAEKLNWSAFEDEINNIKDILGRMKEPKEDMLKLALELKEGIRSILDKVSENEELKKKFDKCLKEYGHLLNSNDRANLINMVDMTMRLNEINVDKVKRLTKKYNVKL